MRKNKYYLLIGSFVIFFGTVLNWGCKKETLNDALPVVKMVSVQQLGTDSVIIKGTIITNDGNDVLYEGFCYGTDPVPPITENQVLLQSDSTNFSAHLYMKLDSIRYFRCFAANSFGYAVSVPVSK